MLRASFSLLWLHSHRNAWANLHSLGPPDTFLVQVVLAAMTSTTMALRYASDELQARRHIKIIPGVTFSLRKQG